MERSCGYIIPVKDGIECERISFRKVLKIGRDKDCDLQVNLNYVSRNHAKICADENENVRLDLNIKSFII